jgi:hypothetical protein
MRLTYVIDRFCVLANRTTHGIATAVAERFGAPNGGENYLVPAENRTAACREVTRLLDVVRRRRLPPALLKRVKGLGRGKVLREVLDLQQDTQVRFVPTPIEGVDVVDRILVVLLASALGDEAPGASWWLGVARSFVERGDMWAASCSANGTWLKSVAVVEQALRLEGVES